MEEDRDWKLLAMESQLQFFETLGSRSYDEIEKSNIFLLKKKVGFATCGKPSELPNTLNFFTGYIDKELNNIKCICKKIVEKSDCDPIKFACTVLILHHKGNICETPVFRIVTVSGNIFIDAHARVYITWKQFMEENKLPDCEYCYPLDGVYTSEKDKLVGFAKSPTCSFVNKATNCLDTAGSVASVAAASVFAAGLMFSVAPAAVAAAGTTAACTGVYSISRSISSLYDRNKHEQSIGLKDPESRSAWLSVGSSLASVATFGALEKAHKIVESGESLSKLSVFGLHALTASSLAFSGFGFVDNLFICADKYNKGVLTKKDIFDLSCELLFFFNAIASAKATTNLVNSMSSVVAETPTVQRKLTNTQKRNLRKRVVKKRGKGLSTINRDVNQTSNSSTGFSTAIQLLLFEAVKAYVPRLEEIFFTYQSIGHDILCWKTSEIADLVFLTNLTRNLTRLYKNYKEEISEAIAKVVKYFHSPTLTDVMKDVYRLFSNASSELKSVFCTKVINMEDQVETLVSEAESEIYDFHEHLEIEVESNTDSYWESNDWVDEIDLNSEAQSLLSACGSVITVSCWPCQDLQEFVDILDSVKYVLISEFKAKVSNYKKSLEAAKFASRGSFDINNFHKALGIHCDVGQHIFDETLQSLTAECTIFQIKTKCKDIQKGKSSRTTPVWEGLTDGIFLYYGIPGAGDLSRSDLLSVVSGIVKVDLTEEDCKLLENKDVVMIEVPVNDETNVYILVYQGITDTKTASGIIMVIK